MKQPRNGTEKRLHTFPPLNMKKINKYNETTQKQNRETVT